MQWYYAKGGERHGPVSVETLRNLLLSNELQPNDLVWQPGMPNWVPLSTVVYPLLGLPPDPAATYAASSPPTTTLQSGTHDTGEHLRPHRGGTLLAIAILSLLCLGLGIILAPMAWIMARNDLKEMKRGKMDPSGEGMTQAAMVISIVSAILHIPIAIFIVLQIVLPIIFVVAAILR